MLDVETNHQQTGEATLKLFFQTFIVVRIITIAEHIGCCQLFLFIADNVDSAECYYTAKEGGVLLRLHIILLDDTEGCFVRLEDSINFMSAQSAVEIQSSIIIYIADGYCIRIAIITKQCQCAGSRLL